MQCLYVAGTMTECLLRRGFCLWEVKNAVFVCGWDHIQVSAWGRSGISGQNTVFEYDWDLD